MVGGRRRKPEGPSARRRADWTRRKELLFPDAEIVVRDREIQPDTRLTGSASCLLAGARRDHHLAVDFLAVIRQPPCGDGRAGSGAGVRKIRRRSKLPRKGRARTTSQSGGEEMGAPLPRRLSSHEGKASRKNPGLPDGVRPGARREGWRRRSAFLVPRLPRPLPQGRLCGPA
jgi:hypothetical protein